MAKLFFYLSILLLTVSCVGSSPSSTRQTTEESTSKDLPVIVKQPYNVYWTTDRDEPGQAVINANIETPILLRGNEIDKLLRNENNYIQNNALVPYCVSFKFNDLPSGKNEMRIKAVPQQVVNYKGESERRLVVLFNGDKQSNIAACGGNDPHIAFTASELCPTCYRPFTSTRVVLLDFATNEIDSSAVNTQKLSISFDPVSSYDPSTQICRTDAECLGIDKDCCLNGQCVDHGAVKPAASVLYPEEYKIAMEKVKEDPNNIYQYEDIFFICPNITPVKPEKPETPDNEKYLQEQIADANCLLDYSKGKYDNCTNSPNFVAPGKISDYIYVKGKVLRACGCNHPQNTYSPYNASPACPDYRYEIVIGPNGTPSSVRCEVIPEDDSGNSEFESTTLGLSTKTVPHRFYQKDADKANDFLSDADINNNIQVEGTPFSYQDEINHSDPQNGSFNMNSILGQMTVDLTYARPAKAIKLDYQQTYVITVHQGSYTPCPQCSADSWYSNFYAHPTGLGKFGMQGAPQTTSRFGIDASYDSNGNYEDTIFGRACFVPPTMIPFTHAKADTVAKQRVNRLRTQSALFVNGYQRDWYGFNKGAPIGSFDGVSWFAIGSSRRVTSTSNKLFLAINAPFGDIASDSTITISVIKDNEAATAASVDYDPNLNPEDPYQNPGASCQKYHYCDNDADCVTQLGWEYVCADISQYQTRWPVFNANGDEVKNAEIAKAKFSTPGKILQGLPEGAGNKRCVYRGAGAPCKANYTELTSKQAKLFTCAPNFYCSNLSNDDFNDQIARTPELQGVVLFGQDANVLGRPLDYITKSTSTSLDLNITSNLRHNAEIYGANTGDWGLCRPGKRLSSDSLEQHRYADAMRRTDFISQISSCDSSLIGLDRTSSCPVLEEDKNSPNYRNYVSNDPMRLVDNNIQNMCGGEARNHENVSAFKSIEAPTLLQLTRIEQPTLALDACLRRAGAICHSDLDCGPNSLHADEAPKKTLSYFGGTVAEREYWQEYLICGQKYDSPTPGTPNYQEYSLKNNRCCRPIGSDITLYTQTDLSLQDPGKDSSLQKLRTTNLSYLNPNSEGRYSRYSIVGQMGPDGSGKPYYGTPIVNAYPSSRSDVYQWKTINETASRTCCGGNFIRKFADGSSSWTNPNRLNFNVTNFRCLNYDNDLVNLETEDLVHFNIKDGVIDEKRHFCEEVAQGGCLERPIAVPSLFEIKLPSFSPRTIGTLDTTMMETEISGTQFIHQSVNDNAPYIPLSMGQYQLQFAVPQVTDLDKTYFTSPQDKTVSFVLPLYIGGLENIESVQIQYVREKDGKRELAGKVTASKFMSTGLCAMPNHPLVDGMGSATNTYCVDPYSFPGFAIFNAAADPAAIGGTWAEAGIIIKFRPANSTNFAYFDQPQDTSYIHHGMTAGNAMYYLTKLARLELAGIPQIVYEPIFCNSDRDRLVPGIFQSSIETREDFASHAFPYAHFGEKSLEQFYDSKAPVAGNDPQNPNSYVTYGDQLGIGQIFSASDMRCCLPLGSTTYDYRECCSGFAVPNDDKSQYICSLARGTDLNVYFNRFVSSEGTNPSDPVQFEDTDFVPETGEPKLTEAVYDKIKALGERYCSSKKVRKGGAFGYFDAGNSPVFKTVNPQDANNKCVFKQFTMVDSERDNEGSTDCGGSNNQLEANDRAGYGSFINGYRWNHHYYCAPEESKNN